MMPYVRVVLQNMDKMHIQMCTQQTEKTYDFKWFIQSCVDMSIKSSTLAG